MSIADEFKAFMNASYAGKEISQTQWNCLEEAFFAGALIGRNLGERADEDLNAYSRKYRGDHGLDAMN